MLFLKQKYSIPKPVIVIIFSDFGKSCSGSVTLHVSSHRGYGKLWIRKRGGCLREFSNVKYYYSCINNGCTCTANISELWQEFSVKLFTNCMLINSKFKDINPNKEKIMNIQQKLTRASYKVSHKFYMKKSPGV